MGQNESSKIGVVGGADNAAFNETTNHERPPSIPRDIPPHIQGAHVGEPTNPNRAPLARSDPSIGNISQYLRVDNPIESAAHSEGSRPHKHGQQPHHRADTVSTEDLNVNESYTKVVEKSKIEHDIHPVNDAVVAAQAISPEGNAALSCRTESTEPCSEVQEPVKPRRRVMGPDLSKLRKSAQMYEKSYKVKKPVKSLEQPLQEDDTKIDDLQGKNKNKASHPESLSIGDTLRCHNKSKSSQNSIQSENQKVESLTIKEDKLSKNIAASHTKEEIEAEPAQDKPQKAINSELHRNRAEDIDNVLSDEIISNIEVHTESGDNNTPKSVNNSLIGAVKIDEPDTASNQNNEDKAILSDVHNNESGDKVLNELQLKPSDETQIKIVEETEHIMPVSEPIFEESKTTEKHSTNQPRDVKSEPGDVKSEPGDVKSEPGNAEPQPNDFKVKPDDVKPQPDDVKSQPGDVKSQPGDVKSQPDDSTDQPVATKIQPMLSPSNYAATSSRFLTGNRPEKPTTKMVKVKRNLPGESNSKDDKNIADTGKAIKSNEVGGEINASDGNEGDVALDDTAVDLHEKSETVDETDIKESIDLLDKPPLDLTTDGIDEIIAGLADLTMADRKKENLEINIESKKILDNTPITKLKGVKLSQSMDTGLDNPENYKENTKDQGKQIDLRNDKSLPQNETLNQTLSKSTSDLTLDSTPEVSSLDLKISKDSDLITVTKYNTWLDPDSQNIGNEQSNDINLLAACEGNGIRQNDGDNCRVLSDNSLQHTCTAEQEVDMEFKVEFGQTYLSKAHQVKNTTFKFTEVSQQDLPSKQHELPDKQHELFSHKQQTELPDKHQSIANKKDEHKTIFKRSVSEDVHAVYERLNGDLDTGQRAKLRPHSISLDDYHEDVQRPPTVPEKLNFENLEKFEGQMLLQWLCSDVKSPQMSPLDTSHLPPDVTAPPTDISPPPPNSRMFAIQFCTHLLAAGVIKPLESSNKMQPDIFRADCMYFWAHIECTHHPMIEVVPVKMPDFQWPPNFDDIEKAIEPDPVSGGSTSHSIRAALRREYEKKMKCFKEHYEQAILSQRGELKLQTMQYEAKIAQLERDLEKYKLLSDIENLKLGALSENQISSDLGQNGPSRKSDLPNGHSVPESPQSQQIKPLVPPPPPPPPPPGGIPPPPPPPGGIPPPPPPPGGIPPPPPPPGGIPPPPPPPGGGPPPPPPIPGGIPPPPGGPGVAMLVAPTAVPRKPVVQPKSPMKALFWRRIQVPQTQSPLASPASSPSRKKPHSVWEDIDELSIDITELDELFSTQKAKPKKDKEKTSKPKSRQVAKLLDSKRSQSVGIFVSSLHMDMGDIEQAVLNFDISVLGLETLQTLYDNRPEMDELKQIKDHVETKPDIALDKPEQFFFNLSQIPNFAERVYCLIFQSQFKETINSLETKLNNLSSLCQELQDSAGVHRILGMILACGNYMNGGNPKRGQADGFQLDILDNIKNIKSKDNSQTLLQFLVTQYIKRYCSEDDPTPSLPIPEPSDITQVSNVNFDDVIKDLKKLDGDLNGISKKMDVVIRNSSSETLQPFKDLMTNFLTEANDLLKEQQENCEESQAIFSKTVSFFCVKLKPPNDGKDPTPRDFFILWVNFCIEFKSTWRKHLAKLSKQRLVEARDRAKELREKKKSSVPTTAKKAGGLKDKLANKSKT
ncbi:unnamed protein product [Owenia fusiformis]|uniref:Uncharacterized protein n=1 Tax=Owenia fusiformis TaxID=6347 RepID=A0A8J1U441_OWEFU|nr:unnamed protein product [Owenia fusiformis]